MTSDYASIMKINYKPFNLLYILLHEYNITYFWKHEKKNLLKYGLFDFINLFLFIFLSDSCQLPDFDEYSHSIFTITI